jgi:hypothetical protein
VAVGIAQHNKKTATIPRFLIKYAISHFTKILQAAFKFFVQDGWTEQTTQGLGKLAKAPT